jgi:L-aminopeptidase/D-esterase-like protein
VGVTKVPLVVQSGIFDLAVGDKAIRPDHAMGREAARLAMEAPNYQDGCYGAGCGATIGKIAGNERCIKTGIGSYAIQVGPLQVGAIVVLNAMGDIYDWKTGRKIAGVINEEGTGFADTVEIMQQSIDVVENRFVANTTLGAIITNAAFTKPQLCKIASMAHNGYGRSIRPVHTTVDGDSIYALSTGDLAADQDLVGTLAADVISQAILCAVRSAESAYGISAARDLDFA